MLPRLKGPAGEYVYDQLSRRQRSSYKELVDCLKKRFRKVESRKMFADMFWKRDQKAGELEETYAVELKRLHGKAWPKRNTESTEEDLLQRFMNGLLDKKAKQQVEFVKNPTNIDNALNEVVKYREACQVSLKDMSTRRHPQRVARTSTEDTSDLTMTSQVVIQKQTLGLPELLESSLLKELAFTARVNRASPPSDPGEVELHP